MDHDDDQSYDHEPAPIGQDELIPHLQQVIIDLSMALAFARAQLARRG